ncbi:MULTISPECIES: FAD-binding oxidoreductase [unclassified Streptomyces]|uniref:FAD-binding oxidoreductase n=1 Tax=unclassified Streptomyces TaxID=2593676 RepID=UPI001F03C10D|nr:MULTISPECIES: FAD-binding oxidoreductase [unclassified Streptomyces]MCH0566864.1 FAD-binding oxidoreductase [Streptomyces sp. MUM 2J]MCH0569839.1 FAD-binding oxidoreductase [Streptomyces sp. MUM 136J]
MIQVSEAESLASRISGEVFLPGQEGFDQERTGYQLAVRHSPDVIVAATTAQDVVAAVDFAVGHDRPVGVQATGHGVSNALDGGVLVSTRRMSDVRVDTGAGTVRLGAGARWEQVIPEAARHGLAPLDGSAPHIGAVSYVLGGGLGLLGRTYGWAADHVRRMEVVTADGRLRQVTPDSEPDLFWALLGGRDNFGVVTALEIGLLPVTRLYGGGMYFDTEHVERLLHTWTEWTATVPEAMNSSVALFRMPDAPMLPAPLRGRYVAHLRIAFTGEPEDGERLIAPLRAVGPPLVEKVTDMPYTKSPTIHNDLPRSMPWYADTAMLDDLTASDTSALLHAAGPDAPVPCILELRHLGGALARRNGVPNAVGHRDARFMFYILSPLGEPFDAEVVAPVQQKALTAVRSRTTGRLLNFMGIGQNAGPEQVCSAYDDDAHRRLVRLKAVYDPANVFRANYNLPPSPSA